VPLQRGLYIASGDDHADELEGGSSLGEDDFDDGSEASWETLSGGSDGGGGGGGAGGGGGDAARWVCVHVACSLALA
jgi:hypothetical protein